ncbi:MAG: maleylpyruvate isomerase N-terminal domain-containing protein [Egibacteraceae bacterium]
MAAVVTADRWVQARGALEAVVPRVTALLRSVRDPGAPALGVWSVAEVATHLTQAWEVIPRLAARQPSLLGDQVLPLGDMGEFADATTAAVAQEPERDLGALADRIEASAARFLRACATARADDRSPWLVEGTKVSRATFVCHLLNESLVHGHDIAQAEGKPWEIDRSHAALVVLGFLVPVLQAFDSRSMVDQSEAAGLRACFEVRVRGAAERVYFVFEDGTLAIDARRPARKVDCHLSVDPTAFLLVAWARTSEWGPIAKGQLLTWGRKPWLGLKFRSLLRNP